MRAGPLLLSYLLLFLRQQFLHQCAVVIVLDGDGRGVLAASAGGEENVAEDDFASVDNDALGREANQNAFMAQNSQKSPLMDLKGPDPHPEILVPREDRQGKSPMQLFDALHDLFLSRSFVDLALAAVSKTIEDVVKPKLEYLEANRERAMSDAIKGKPGRWCYDSDFFNASRLEEDILDAIICKWREHRNAERDCVVSQVLRSDIQREISVALHPDDGPQEEHKPIIPAAVATAIWEAMDEARLKLSGAHMKYVGGPWLRRTLPFVMTEIVRAPNPGRSLVPEMENRELHSRPRNYAGPYVETVRFVGPPSGGEVSKVSQSPRRSGLLIFFPRSSFPDVPQWYDSETKRHVEPEGLIGILEYTLGNYRGFGQNVYSIPAAECKRRGSRDDDVCMGLDFDLDASSGFAEGEGPDASGFRGLAPAVVSKTTEDFVRRTLTTLDEASAREEKWYNKTFFDAWSLQKEILDAILDAIHTERNAVELRSDVGPPGGAETLFGDGSIGSIGESRCPVVSSFEIGRDSYLGGDGLGTFAAQSCPCRILGGAVVEGDVAVRDDTDRPRAECRPPRTERSTCITYPSSTTQGPRV